LRRVSIYLIMATKKENKPLQTAGAIIVVLGAIVGGYYIYKKAQDVDEGLDIINIGSQNNIPAKISLLVKQVRSALEGLNFTANPTTINKITTLTPQETIQFMYLYEQVYGIDAYTDISIESDFWGQYTPALNHMENVINLLNGN